MRTARKLPAVLFAGNASVDDVVVPASLLACCTRVMAVCAFAAFVPSSTKVVMARARRAVAERPAREVQWLKIVNIQ